MLAVGVSTRSPELSKAEDQSPSLSAGAWHDLQICSVISDNWKEVKNLTSLPWERIGWAGRWQNENRTWRSFNAGALNSYCVSASAVVLERHWAHGRDVGVYV